MAALSFDSALYGGLLSDSETAHLMSDAVEISAMIRVEKALAIVEAKLGIIQKKRWLCPENLRG